MLDGAKCQDNLQTDAADATQIEMEMISLKMIAGHNELSRFWGEFEALSGVVCLGAKVESTERRYAARRSRDPIGCKQL